MKRVDVLMLKKELDPIAGMSAHIQKNTLLHPRDDYKTAVEILELDGDFTLEDLRRIIDAYDDMTESMIGDALPSFPAISCEDCGLPYDKFGLDTTLPDDQWLMIHPSGEGGVLCATCIARRGHAVPGVVAVRAVFDNPIELLNGGEAPKAPPIEKFMIYLVHEGDYENRSVVRAYIGPCNLGDYYVLEDQFIEQHPELFVAVGTRLDKNHPQYKYNLMYEQRLELDRLYSDKFEDWLTMSLGLMAIPFMEIF